MLVLIFPYTPELYVYSRFRIRPASNYLLWVNYDERKYAAAIPNNIYSKEMTWLDAVDCTVVQSNLRGFVLALCFIFIQFNDACAPV